MIAVMRPAVDPFLDKGHQKRFGPLGTTMYPSGKYFSREDRFMANRRFEMYQYRQIIHRMRMGQTDRAIARSKLMVRAMGGEPR